MTGMNERIVVIGGGGGVERLLRLLKTVRKYLISIHTVFDNGGDTGRLRKLLGIFGIGDIRRGIAALADEELPWVRDGLMDFAFPDGIKFGNALIASLIALHPEDEMVGVNLACQMMGVKGKVLPISLDRAHLQGWDINANLTKTGETGIDLMSPFGGNFVNHVILDQDASLYVETHNAMMIADKMVVAPGDPFTSIYPNTLVRGFKEAIKEWKKLKPDGKIGGVCNLLTKKVESPNWTASEFARRLAQRLDIDKLDFFLVNNATIPPEVMSRYEEMGSFQVKVDLDLDEHAHHVIRDDFIELVYDPIRKVRTVRHNKRTANVLANDI